MDKIGPAIDWMKKNKFWLGSGLLSVLAIGIWFLGYVTIGGQTDENEKTVKSNIRTAEGILKKTALEVESPQPLHPNNVSIDGMKDRLEASADSVVASWKILVDKQSELLVWPSVIGNERFRGVFGQFNPPETCPEDWQTKYGFETLLDIYESKINEHVTNLCKKLGTRWSNDPSLLEAAQDDGIGGDGDDGGLGLSGGGFPGLGGSFPGLGGGGNNSDDLNKYPVIWSQINQELWLEKLTKFQYYDDNVREVNSPTPLQCYMLQQDLWLLEAMFTIIKNINGNSTANDLSVIKRIDHVLFGREAGGKQGKLTPVDSRLAGPGAEVAASGGLDVSDNATAAAGASEGGLLPPYHMRYVDINFEPLASSVVKGVIDGTDLPENNIELIVAKRVPVRIALKMDERRIADFMAECANSPFAFEIQQVRWNRHAIGGESVKLAGANGGGQSSAGGGGFPGLTGGSAGFGGGISGFGDGLGGGAFSGAFGGGGNKQQSIELESSPIESRSNYDVNVEFYGIVKIYNPVNGSRLRKAADLSEKNAADPADAAKLNRRPAANPSPTS